MAVTLPPEQREDEATTSAQLARRRWTVAEYYRMGEAGILTEDDRVELIGGEIVEMSPIGTAHVWSVSALAKHAERSVGDKTGILVQSPFRLADDKEPQPDLVLVRLGTPRDRLPGPADVLLVIEVADSSRAYDRGVKLPLYAAAGIPEAWLVDLVAATLERFTEPREGRYRQVTLGGGGDTLASTVLPGLAIPVDVALGGAG